MSIRARWEKLAKKPRVARVLGFFRRARELEPITFFGVLVASLGALAFFHFGLKRIDLVLLVAGALALGLVALTLLTTSLVAVFLWRSLRKRAPGDPLHQECGFSIRTGFSIPTLWYVPFVKVKWAWSEPRASVKTVRNRGRFWEEVIPERRGMIDHISRTFDVYDVFGFNRITFSLREARPVRLVPSVGALKTMHVVRSIAGGSDISHPEGPAEGERMDMRHYNPGDPIRYVLWKVFARSRELVVRTPERAISPIRQTVAYLVAAEGDEAAAGAARVAVDCGALGGEWVFGTDGGVEPAKTKHLAHELLAKSAHIDPSDSGAGLRDFLQKATPASVGRTVVFVPGRPGPWLDRVIAAARAKSSPNQPFSPVEFIVCADGVQRAPKMSRWKKWFTRAVTQAESGAVVDADEVAQVMDALAASRSRVLVVDRKRGQVYTEGVRRSIV